MKKSSFILLYIIFSILTTFALKDININAYKAISQTSFLQSTNFDSLVFHQSNSTLDNDFYLLNKITNISFDNNRLNIDYMMLKENTNYNLFDLENIKLKYNETLISENLAKLHNIKIGDKLLRTNVFNDKQEFIFVVGYIKTSYAISIDYLSTNTGLIISGYDNTMPEKNESIVFTDFSDKINDLFISKISNINDQVKNLKRLILDATIINFIIISTLSILTIIFSNIIHSASIKKNIKSGKKLNLIFYKYYLTSVLLTNVLCCSFLVTNYIFMYIFFGKTKFNFYDLNLMILPIIVYFVQLININFKIRGV